MIDEVFVLLVLFFCLDLKMINPFFLNMLGTFIHCLLIDLLVLFGTYNKISIRYEFLMYRSY